MYTVIVKRYIKKLLKKNLSDDVLKYLFYVSTCNFKNVCFQASTAIYMSVQLVSKLQEGPSLNTWDKWIAQNNGLEWENPIQKLAMIKSIRMSLLRDI